MKFINFGKIDRKILIPIFGGIAMLIYQYIFEFFPKNEIISQNPFLLNIYFSIGMIFALIPYLIFKNRNKQVNNTYDNSNLKKDESKLNIDLIYDESSNTIKTNKYRYIILSSICDFIQTLLYNLFTIKCVYNTWFFDITFISLFAYLFLKMKLYKHQYISMIIIIIFGLGLNIIEYFKFDEEENKIDFFETIMKLISEIFFSLVVVISKYNMEKNYCSPYEICVWEGAITLFLHIICLVVTNLIGPTIFDIKYPDNFFEYFENYDIYDFIICLIVIIISIIYNILFFLTCDYFSPFHILITSIIEECYNYFQINEDLTLNILGITTLILIGFTFLIFIEIIELNICNISFYTKNNIVKRSKEESFLGNEKITERNEEINEEEEKSNSSNP